MADESQLIYANYLAAKSYQQLGNVNMAIESFEVVKQLSTNQYGAEAQYELALNAFSINKLDDSENMVYELKKKYAAYSYWVAKGFILLADIYAARGNTFQAEQTLQSIIDNYSGEDLKEIARKKISQLKADDE
jgi:predicted negative regulator of RcsB-dependent stress response